MNGTETTRERRLKAAAELTPGRIVLLTFPDIDHDKFMVVLRANPALWGFFINSEIHVMFAHSRQLAACHVPIAQADHGRIFKKDSYLNCTQIINALPLMQAVTQVTGDPSRLKGNITPAERVAIVIAVQAAPTLSRVEKKAIVDSL